MSEALRLRIYLAGVVVTAALLPLAVWAALTGERAAPPGEPPARELEHAMDDLRILLASRGLPGVEPSRTLEGIPSDPSLAWLEPVIRAEVLGEHPPPPQATGQGSQEPEIADLFRKPPPAPDRVAAIAAAIDAEVPFPFLRLLLHARAADLTGGGGAARARVRAEEMASAVVARVTVLSAYFLLLFVAGLAVLLHVTTSRRPHAPLPAIAAVDGWGLFVTWLGAHFLAMAVVSTVPLAAPLRLPVMALAYLAVGGGVLFMGGRVAGRPQGMTLTDLLGLRGGTPAAALGLAALAAAVPLVLAAYALSTGLLGVEGSTQSSMLPLLVGGGWGTRLGILLLVCIGAPLVEEGIFRGLLLPAMVGRMSPHAAIALNGLLFGLVHLDPPVVLPLAALGSVLAWLRLRSGSLVPGMVAHGLWNLQTVTIVTLLLGPVHVA